MESHLNIPIRFHTCSICHPECEYMLPYCQYQLMAESEQQEREHYFEADIQQELELAMEHLEFPNETDWPEKFDHLFEQFGLFEVQEPQVFGP